MPLTRPAAVPNVAPLAAKLHSARNHLWMAIGQVALGLVTTFILPMIFLGIFSGVPWPLFWPILAVVITLMYLSEWRTHGEYYLMQARYTRQTYYSSHHHWRSWADSEVAALPVIWEILLFAPRQVFEGATWLRCVLTVRSADLSRAAEILRALLTTSHAVPVKDLQKPNEPPLAFGQAMAHLLVHEWVSAGEAQGGQVWLPTESREALLTV